MPGSRFNKPGCSCGNKGERCCLVEEDAPNSGMLMISGGDVITIDVLSGSGDIQGLFVQDLSAGLVLYSDNGVAPQHFKFTATANHIYEVQSNVYES